MNLRARSCLLGALLLSATVGCAGAGQSVKGMPRVVAVSPAHLVVRGDSVASGGARLLVLREWTREMERDARIPFGPRGRQVASVGVYGDPGPLLGVVVVVAVIAVVCVVVGIVWIARESVVATLGPLMPKPGPADVVRFVETLREPVLRAKISAASGTAAIDLGIQPMDGYLLDDSALRLLGGPGAEVVIRAGDLSVFTRLPEPR